LHLTSTVSPSYTPSRTLPHPPPPTRTTRQPCLTSLQPYLASRNGAGIHPEEIARAVTLAAEIKSLDVFSPAADKLAKLMRETRLDRGHQLAGILTEAAAQARRRADRDPNGASSILAPLEELLEFQYGPAAKASVTRGKAKAKETTEQPKPAGV
jgi:hypothetical protein